MTISELRADANRRAVQSIAHADPVWVDVQPAGEFLTDLPPRTVLHSGPPLPFAQLCGLHRRGAINGALLEGWAADEADAVQQLSDGRIRVDSAMNYNTVGSGVGIVTPSVPLLIVADRRTGCRAGVFPAEGRFGGGFCGWGVYSPEIRDNLRWMRDELFAPLRPLLRAQGFPLRELFAEGVQMGDEFHSRQTAGDLLFIRKIIPFMQDGGIPADAQARLLRYFADTGRFFHNFGQASARSALLSAERIPYCTMVTAAGGNGVEYGIQVSATGRTWYTAPSPMIEGSNRVPGLDPAQQLPWIGDSSITECAGLGGILSAASPIVCSWRSGRLTDGAAVTREMAQICIGTNPQLRVPALDFGAPPCGIDAVRAAETGITPVIDGGMISSSGGWMGAGCTRIPHLCFVKAAAALDAAATE